MKTLGWVMLLGVVLGLPVGIGIYTFSYARGFSYLTNDPSACANCHVMRENYDGWMQSSHRNVAVCNDCHAPHNVIGKYWTKLRNGFFHSVAFTSGRFHEPIRIKSRNRSVTEGTCLSCHQDIVEAIEGIHYKEISCLRCHSGVGHAK